MKEITYAFPKLKDVEPSVYIDAYKLLLECSNTRTPQAFIQKYIELLGRVCSFDQAIAFYHDLNGKIAGIYSVGTKKGWLESYLNYYIEIASEEELGYDMSVPNKENPQETTDRIIDWDSVQDSRFKREYIDAVNLKYSWAFFFFDMNGNNRVTICLDKRHKVPFTESEKKTIGLTLPILNNMYRNYFYEDVEEMDLSSMWEEYGLTSREKEIADLLCQGMKASRISELLFISEGTSHKHIAHIYRKTRVTSQTELIARMLSKRGLS